MQKKYKQNLIVMLANRLGLKVSRVRKTAVAVVLGLLTISSLFAILSSAPPAQAAIPKLINFQGKLTNVANGTNVPNGNYTFEFKLYDAPTSGTLLWTETWDGSPSPACDELTVTNGVFNAKLGQCNPLTGVDFTSGNLYLSVNFDDGSGFDGEMTPRKQLVSSAFAFVANSLNGDGTIDITNTATSQATINYDASNKLQVGVASTGFTTLNVSGSAAGFNFTGGNVGIGDASPAAMLTVGSGDLFQVNSSGAIAAATGITSSGTVTFSGLGGSGTRCLQVDNSGLISAAGAGCLGSMTPWTSDIDGDGYDLKDLSNLEFRNTTGAPAGSVVAIFSDNTGDLNLNSLTGKTTNIQVNGTDEYNFSSTTLNLNSNTITNAASYNGLVVTANTGVITTGTWNGTALTDAYVSDTLTSSLFVGSGSTTTAIDLATAEVAGTLPVNRGGSGAATLTSNGVLYGNGTSAIQATAQGGANTVLVANGGAPSFSSAITVGTSVTSPSLVGSTSVTTPLLTSTGALAITPAAGSGLSVNLSTTGDFAVNTDQLYVDTSTGNVGVGLSNPNYNLEVNGSFRSGGVSTGLLWYQPNNTLYISSATTNDALQITKANTGISNFIKLQDSATGGYFALGSSGSNFAPTYTSSAGSSPNDFTSFLSYTGDTSSTAAFQIDSRKTSGPLTSQPIFGVASYGSTKFIVGANGSVGIGDTSPASLLTVGNGDLFQVNSSGAIAAATGITSSGTITFSGLGGGGTQCVSVDNSGILGTTACTTAYSLWTADTDADGYDLKDLSNLEFRNTTGAPAGSVVAVFSDNTGDLNLNALTGKSVNLQVNGTDEYNFSSTALNLNSNNITGAGSISATSLALTGAITGATSYNGLVVTPNTGVITTGTWNGTALTDAYVSDTLTSSIFIGSGSTTNAIDLATAEVAGTLPVNRGGSGAATLTGLLLGNGTSPFTAVTTSSGISGALSDETGSGALVFASNPTLSGATFANATNIVLNTTTGTKIGTATNQKLGFYNATPIVQPTGNIITALGNLGLVGSPTLPASSVSSGAALTKNDDTNVTLTLGGSPSTSLLAATSLTLGWSGQLSVARGGTGAATFASNGVLYGNGTSAIQATAQGGANTVLVANGGAPSFSAAITVGTSVTSPTINATSALQFNGANINTGGTLSNVAYLDQANTFTQGQTISSSSGSPLTLDAGSQTNVYALSITNQGAGTSGIHFDPSGSAVAAIMGTTGGRFSNSYTNSGGLTQSALGNGLGIVDNGAFRYTTDANAAGSFESVMSLQAGGSQKLLMGLDSSANEVFSIGYNGDAVFNNLSLSGAITAGTWNGTVVGSQYGGTGVNNGSNTITLGGNINTAGSFTTAGAYALTLTQTAATNVTLPATGTLATLAGAEALTNKTVNGVTLTAAGSATKYLNEAGAYVTIGGGTVTSVASADGSITVTNPSSTVDLSVVEAPKWTTPRLLAGNSVDGSTNVAFSNKFIAQGTSDAGLSGAQFLGALSTGIVKNTTTTGVLSIANPGTDYEVPLTFSTGLTRSTNTITVNSTQNITRLSNLTTNGFVKTTAANGTLTIDTNTYLTGNQAITLSGDVSGTGSTAISTTLATVNSNVGTFGSSTSIPSFTVNGKGLITAASGNAVIAPAGTLTGTALNPTVVTSSLTSVGTITSGTWNGTALTDAYVSDTLTSSLFVGSGSTTTAIDLATAEVAGTLPVARGGSGATTFTSNGVLYGNGTSAIGVTAAGTTGQCLVATTSAAPSWGSCGITGVAWSDISAPTGNLSLAHGANTTNFTFNGVTTANAYTMSSSSLSSGSLLNLAVTSTAATSNTQKVLNVSAGGTNATSNQTTYAGYFSNTHTGSNATNIAAYFSASGASNLVGVSIGNAISGVSGSGVGVKIGTISADGGNAYGVQIGDVSNGNETNSLKTGNVSGSSTLSSTLGQLNLGNVTLSSSGSALAQTGFGIQTGTISGGASNSPNTYGLNLGANSAIAVNNYGINIGAISGAGTTNIGLNIGTVSGATNNYALITNGGNVGIGTTTPVALMDIQGSSYTLGGNGDATLSGSVNVGDYTKVASYLNGSVGLTPAEYAQADVNGDGRVTYLDRDLISKIALGTLLLADAQHGVGKYLNDRAISINMDGNVGIGTFGSSSPSSVLQVRQFADSTSTTNPIALNVDSVGAAGELTAASGIQTFAGISPVINQSSTAGYTALLVNATQTATGSGTKKLLDLQVGGTTQFAVGNTGIVTSGTWNGTALTDAYVSDTLTSSLFVGSGSTTTAIDLATAEVAGTLPVNRGGTGAATFTSNGVLYGNGTSAIGVTAAGTTGQCLVGNTGSAPSWGSCGSNQTPWTSDIDADNYDLLDFGDHLTARAGLTVTATAADLNLATTTSGDINLATAGGTSIELLNGMDGILLTGHGAVGIDSYAANMGDLFCNQNCTKIDVNDNYEEITLQTDGSISLGPAGSSVNISLDAGTAGTIDVISQETTTLGGSDAKIIIDNAGDSIYFYGDSYMTLQTTGTLSLGDISGNANNTYLQITDSSRSASLSANNFAYTSGVSTGTGTSSGFSLQANSLTTGTGANFSSTSLTSGSLVNIDVNSTAAASNTQKALNIVTAGANATSTQTTYGGYFANTHTGTDSTNVAGYFSASGGTNNYAGIFNGGNVGIGTTAPIAMLDVQGSSYTLGGSGDTTGNGTTSSTDVTRIHQYLMNLVPLTQAEYARADINGDGQVTWLDAQLISQLNIGGVTLADAHHGVGKRLMDAAVSVDFTGNVGINTAVSGTTPTSVLQVQQSADSTSTSNPIALNVNSVGAAGELTATTGIQTFAAISPVINQSSTAGYTALLVNATQTATGSGTKKLLDLQVGGATQFAVGNTGVITTGTWNGTALTDAYVSDTLTSSLFVGSGSTTTAIDLATAEVAGTLPISKGGTGGGTFTSNGVLYGNGTSAIQATAQGGANTVLVANGGAPSFSSAITVGTSVTSPSLVGSTSVTTPLLTSTGALAITPASGSSVSINLSSTGDFAVNTNQLYVDTSTARVGIGLTGPTTELDINGTLRVRSGNGSGSFTNDQILFSYNGGSGYTHAIKTRHDSTSQAGNAIDFSLWNYGTDSSGDVGTKQVMTLLGNGNVGIGTTAPASLLEIDTKVDALTTGIFLAAGTGSPVGSQLQVGFSTGTNESTFDLKVYRAGFNVSRLAVNRFGDVLLNQTDGKVGIGTTSPSKPFEIGTYGASDARVAVEFGGNVNPTLELKGGTGSGYYPQISLCPIGDCITAGLGISGYGGGILGSRAGNLLRLQNVGWSGTNTVHSSVSLEQLSSGTPADGFGTSFDFKAQTDGVSYAMPMSSISSYWTDVTHATRTANLAFSTVSNGTSTQQMTIQGNGQIGIGASTSLTGKLHVVGSVTTSGASAVAGIYEDLTLSNSTSSGFQFGNRLLNTVNGSVAGTHVGQFIRMTDSTSLSSGQVVRGLEVQAWSGTNNNGINTGIATYGKTFGLQAETSAQAGGVSQPAAVFAYLNNASGQEGVGNAIRAYTDKATSANLVSLYQETSAFTGGGIVMDFGNNSGSFTGNFISLKKAGTESFHVDDDGSTFVSLTGTQNTVALCHATNGQTNNDEIVDCSGAPSDVAEYFGTTDSTLSAAEVVVSGANAEQIHLDGYHTSKAWIARATKAYQNNIIGVISTAPAAVYGDEIFNASENPRPVALVGRVPVKVTAENGEIKAGDYLTSSAAEPGKAMKATRSGIVIGQALSSYDGTGEAVVVVFVQVGFQSIGNTIVLDAPTATGLELQGDEETLSNTASTFTIQQQAAEGSEEDAPVSNILQLQTGDANRFMVSSTGATSILSNLSCDPEAASDECPSVLKVTQANTELMNIDARGTLTLAGTIIIKDDTFAGSVATDADGLAEITFSYNLGTGKPVVQLTAEAQIPVFAQILEFKQDEHGNYTGFVIKTFDLISGPVQAIVHYNVTGKQAGYITFGEVQNQPLFTGFSGGSGAGGSGLSGGDFVGGDGAGLVIEGGEVVGGSGTDSGTGSSSSGGSASGSAGSGGGPTASGGSGADSSGTTTGSTPPAGGTPPTGDSGTVSGASDGAGTGTTTPAGE